MMKNKKKSAPGGTPIPKQDYGTTPSLSCHAEILFDRIKTGKENALRVDNRFTGFRKLVAEANKNGDCIINNGDGYYRPGPDDEDEFRYYIHREMHRAQEIDDKVQAMREAYYGRY